MNYNNEKKDCYSKKEFEEQLKVDNKKIIGTIDIDEILNFCYNHRVEILLQDDMQFHCFIDYPENKSSYGIELDAFTSMIIGIKTYLKKI
jgi:hypothetical protein